MDTGTLPTAIPVPVEVSPGAWRREASHCPVPLTPFFRGATGVVTECFRRLFDELGVLYETLEYREIGGWVYTGLVAAGGVEGEAPTPELIRQRAERAVELVQSGWFDQYLAEWPQRRSEFSAGVTRLRAVDLGSLSDQELAGQFGQVMEFSLGAFDVHFMLQCIHGIMMTDLAYTCRDLLGWDEPRTLELLSGLSKASTGPARAVAGLAAMAGERPAVRRFLDSGATEESRLADIDPDFAAALAAYHEEFGLRPVRYEVDAPSIEETPAFTLRLIADQLRTGYDPATPAAAAARRREAVAAEARALLADHPAEDRDRFERVLGRAEAWYGVREDKASMTFNDQVALIRRLALEIGRRLAESSLIDEPDDVFFLGMEEAVGAVVTRAAGPALDCRELVRRRRAERAWVEAHPGPLTYGPDAGLPPGFDDLPPEARLVTEAQFWLTERAGHFVSTPPQPGGPVLSGVPASRGTYTGTVRVLLSEADFGKFEPGDVLVCPMTCPAWSVLFPNVGALVTDTGGLLSHPAIISREFQIPAVVATGNATSLLHDGQRVTVDGTAGTIEVVE